MFRQQSHSYFLNSFVSENFKKQVNILYVLLLLFSLFIVGCREEEGFTEGPFLRVYNASSSELEIIFDNNAGIKDSLVCTKKRIKQIPIDMYAQRMNFVLRGDSAISKLSLEYSIVIRRKKKKITLNLENIIGILSPDKNDHQLRVSSDNWPLTTLSDWSFVNNTNYVLWVE